jgi:hypothetical protein
MCEVLGRGSAGSAARSEQKKNDGVAPRRQRTSSFCRLGRLGDPSGTQKQWIELIFR